MAKKLINIIIIFISVSFLYNPTVRIVKHLNNCPNGIFDYCEDAYNIHKGVGALICMSFIVFAYLAVVYYCGAFDDLIKEKLDPKVNSLYNFLNRRNNTND